MKKIIKQKLIGVLLAILAIATIFIDYDITACVVFLPLGLLLIFSKKLIITE